MTLFKLFEILLLLLLLFNVVVLFHNNKCTNAFSITSTITLKKNSNTVVTTNSRLHSVIAIEQQKDEELTTTIVQHDNNNHKIQHRDVSQFDRNAFIMGFQNPKRQACYVIKDVEFPKDLHGTFYQNGHAKFQISNNNNESVIIHPFDGDGMITAITFNDGTGWFRNRMIQTEGYIKELEQQKICYRGVFGTAINNGNFWSNFMNVNYKNVANTHVLFTSNSNNNNNNGDNTNNKNKLFALWEAGRPYEINPITLETINPGKETNWDNTLPERYSAHYKIDPDTKNICSFSMSPGKLIDPFGTHNLIVMEHDQNQKLVYKKSYFFNTCGFAHDMGMTKNYFIFLQTNVKINVVPFLLGQKGIAQCIEYNDNNATTEQTAKLVLVPRGPLTDEEPITIEIPNAFSFHYANAYEDDDDGTIKVDLSVSDTMVMTKQDDKYPSEPFWITTDVTKELASYSLRRYTIDMKTKSIQSIISMTDNYCAIAEFPIINPNYVSKKYKYAYCLASPSKTDISPVQGLIKVNVEVGTVVEKWIPKQPYQFISEMTFASKNNNNDTDNNDIDDDNNNYDIDDDDDNGYLIGYMMDAKIQKSFVIIFDAKNITQGPIVQGQLQDLLPFSLHGTFVNNYIPNFPGESIINGV